MKRPIKQPYTMTTAVGYVRVSTEEQSLGADVQRSRIQAYCISRGWDLVTVIEDIGESGKSLNRDGIDKVRRIIKKRMVGAVVALKLDRLTRSVADLNTLLTESGDSGVALVSITETLDTSSAGGRLMVNMLAVLAEWERETIAERTSQALAVKSSRGERVGRFARIGSDNGEGARSEHEKKLLEVVRQIILSGSDCEYNEGAISLRCIAEQLEILGFRNRAGKRYGSSTIWRLLQRIEEDGEEAPTDTTPELARKIERTRAERKMERERVGRELLRELIGDAQ